MQLLRFFCACLFALPLVGDSLTLMTEERYPYSYEKNGEATGVYVRIIQDAMKMMGEKYAITILPWEKAYAKAASTPGHALFGTLKTSEREEHFRWACALHNNPSYFLQKRGDSLPSDYNELKKADKIGLLRGSIDAKPLQRNGFENLASFAMMHEGVEQLASGKLDYLVTNTIIWNGYRQEHPVEAAGVVSTGILANETEVCLAFHPETDQVVVQQWEQALKTLHLSGISPAYLNRHHAGAQQVFQNRLSHLSQR